jgi:hypothetical protein
VTQSATVIGGSGSAFIVRLHWRPAGADADREQFQVLRTRNDKVIEMRDYRTEREAKRAAR